MKLTYIKSILLLTVILLNLKITAQNVNTKIKTKYSYSFYAEMNETSILKIEEEVKSLKNVTEVKVKYKAGNKSALLIVIVREAKRTKESDVLFQPIDLKRIISKHGFIPNELVTETFSK